jgi:hypothetical protein
MNSVTGGKGCLFVVAIGAGVGAGVGVYALNDQMAPSIFLGLGLALLYTVIAAGIVHFCETLEKFAFPDDRNPWDAETRAYLGAFWPLSLLFWMVITPFFAIINRLFR